ncbi:MAG: hypothetical protein CVT48_01505 [Thermoplasmata archaeon HGW-Thermoplasmata-1]|nr:MAG: hypothetical protein CVT48_01505 [Thermoplasmata archaeon HGW-Thermoplasmata-1]
MHYSLKNILKESIPILTVCVTIAVMAGMLLQSEHDKLVMFPFLLAFVPVLNGVGGNLGSVIGSRVASGLHVGYIQPNLKGNEIKKNIILSFVIGIATYLLLVICTYWIFPLLGVVVDVGLFRFAGILLLAAMLLITAITFLSVAIAFISFKKGADPDNVVIPLVTSIGDMLGITFLTIAIRVIGL